MKNKPVIAVDIDEVLYPYVPSLISYLDKEHKVKLSQDDFKLYDIRKVWGGGPEEAAEIFEKYKQQSGIHISPLKDAAKALERLSKDYDIVVLTARPLSSKDRTVAWVEHHFPAIFSDIHLVGNSEDSPDNWRPKAEVCVELGASYLIDDTLKTVLQTSALGVKALLFGDYAWNQAESLPEAVTRVKNWQEVIEYFNEN